MAEDTVARHTERQPRIKVCGLPTDSRPRCAMSGCNKRGWRLDPRPRSELSILHSCGYFYLCREHYRPAAAEWRAAGSPTAPMPSIIPGSRAAVKRARALLARLEG